MCAKTLWLCEGCVISWELVPSPRCGLQRERYDVMKVELRILLVEDVEDDALLVERALRKGGLSFASQRVATREDFLRDLTGFKPHLILSDFSLQGFDGAAALRLCRKLSPEVPFIFVSGVLGEENVVEMIKLGGTDVVLKHRLARLVPAVERALREAAERVELEKAQEALRRSEERFRALIENSSDAVVLTDSKGILMYCTPSLVRLLGYTEEESLGRNAFEFVHSEDHALTKNARAELLRSRGKTITIQTRVRHKDGSWRWAESVCMNLLDKPGVQAIVANFRDITERKEAEEEREKLIRELQSALAQVTTLSGLLPICAWCKKIRDDEGYWQDVEGYLRKHSQVDFSHGICPDCVAKYRAEYTGGRTASE